MKLLSFQERQAMTIAEYAAWNAERTQQALDMFAGHAEALDEMAALNKYVWAQG